MRFQTWGRALLAAASLLWPAYGRAQGIGPLPDRAGPNSVDTKRADMNRVDLVVAYNALEANVIAGSRFWMSGGSAQAAVHLPHGWSCVGEVAGQHAGNLAASGTGLNLFTLTFGPQYAVHVRRTVLFGQARVGLAWGSDGLFPTATSAPTSGHGAAFALGGGVDLPLSRRLSFRLAQVEWSRTQLNNLNDNSQNNLRLSAGVVVHLP